MRANPELKLHFLNVNHGDATIIEFPDYTDQNTAHFGVVDFGAKFAVDRDVTVGYFTELLALRRDDDPTFDYRIHFICATHPHDDHYGGLNRFLDVYGNPLHPIDNKVEQFWDCGFRTNSTNYNRALNDIAQNNGITFVRVSAGAEFKFGDTNISVLAPSIDLRNRFDTWGIKKNDSSIVLKIKHRNSYIIIAGDAEFASWGKTTEEFPRRERITFYKDALGLAERDETSDQLKCNLLRLSHHGSKRGTSFEYLERLKPRHIVISAGSQQWYLDRKPDWAGDFPHPLITDTINQLNASHNLGINPLITGQDGNIIFKYGSGPSPSGNTGFITSRPGDAGFRAELTNNWP
jgi:competence protein ComEC